MKTLSRGILLVLSLSIFASCWCDRIACASGKVTSDANLTTAFQKGQSYKTAGAGTGSANIYNNLRQVVDLSSLTIDTTFGEAVEILRNSTRPPLNIVVLWRDLRENALIEAQTPIQFEGVSGVPLHFGLELLLRAVSNRSAKVGYVIENGVIIVGTSRSLPAKMTARVYDITDVTAGSDLFGFFRPQPGGFGYRPNLMTNQSMGPVGGGSYNRRALRNSSRNSGNYSRPARRSGTNTPTGRLTPYPRARGANEITHLIQNAIEPDSWHSLQ